ncbi:MAG: methylenetetrahydrofolate--tRNA-(uracil(54)-C(5))-methyltransferase (FADH(2)-oxidizing) TrmFO, partial [Candidatus Dadabacteria bacterium]
MTEAPVIVIGGGLAGCEAAWALAQRGIDVELFEMRPGTATPAHRTGDLAELVCSNSFRGAAPHQAPGLLKEEMRRLGSLVMQAAAAAEVPAGGALAVDRELFSSWITERIAAHPRITLRRERVDALPETGDVIVATGPLTDAALQADLERRLGSSALAFYDAIAPVVTRDSIDWEHAYLKDRWQDDTTGAAYVNCPLDRATYERFVARILEGPFVPYKAFEENIRHFEGCLPIEEMAARGIDTLRHGPMKPVGLKHPETGELPWAVVQLRPDNRAQILLNLVGFQTKMTWDAQKDAFRMIPALRNATFVRLGSMHRNTFIDSPRLLNADLSWRSDPRIRFAGQMTGVEGYIESAVSGLIAGLATAAARLGEPFAPPPPETATGALLHYISDPVVDPFQPMNINFGLFPPLQLADGKRPPKGRARRALYA